LEAAPLKPNPVEIEAKIGKDGRAGGLSGSNTKLVTWYQIQEAGHITRSRLAIYFLTHLSQAIPAPHLRRQHQRPPLIPPVEIRQHARRPCRLVFMQEMPRVREDLHLEFALHLPDLGKCQNFVKWGRVTYQTHHQRLIQPIRSRQQQQLRRPRRIQELRRQPREPLRPIWLRRAEVRQPGVRLRALLDLLQQGRDRHTGRARGPDCAGAGVPFDGGGKGGEGGGARGEVGFHGGEGVDGGAFDDVEDGVPQGWGMEEAGVRCVGDDGAAKGVAEEEYLGWAWEVEEGKGLVEDVDEVGGEGREGKIDEGIGGVG
jgi:hypothetical protein